MKTIQVVLFLAIVLVVSSAGSMAGKAVGPNYFQDTCSAVIPAVPRCEAAKCAADCARRFKGGVGNCAGVGCRCVYTCAVPSI
nr:defensin-like protein 124 [Lolium perenne]